jgi:hypothetical protein
VQFPNFWEIALKSSNYICVHISLALFLYMTLFDESAGREELPDVFEADLDALIVAASEEDPEETSEDGSADPNDPEDPKFQGHSKKDIRAAFELIIEHGGSVQAAQEALDTKDPSKALGFRALTTCFTFLYLDLATIYAKLLPGGKMICPCCDEPRLTSQGAHWAGIKFIHTEDKPMLVLPRKMVCSDCPKGNGECKITLLDWVPSSPS